MSLERRLFDPGQQVGGDRTRFGLGRDERPPTGSVSAVSGSKDVGSGEKGRFDLIERGRTTSVSASDARRRTVKAGTRQKRRLTCN